MEILKNLTQGAPDDTFVCIRKDEYTKLLYDSYVNCNVISTISLGDLFGDAKSFKAQRMPIDAKIVNRILDAMHKSKVNSPLLLKKIPKSVDKRGGQKIFT